MLPQINDQQWHVIVVMHTRENLKRQADADVFIKRVKDINDVVVLSTSGTGKHKIQGVDAISSASKIADIPTRIQEIFMRLDSILNRE